MQRRNSRAVVYNDYQHQRYHILHELRVERARERVNGIDTSQSRAQLKRELCKLRKEHYASGT